MDSGICLRGGICGMRFFRWEKEGRGEEGGGGVR